jgi:uncharacterized protein (DUF58 family)
MTHAHRPDRTALLERGHARTKITLRRLELLVTNRLEGLLHGEHQGLVPGPGTEADESRVYQPGDDIRLMDWNVTARTRVPHVRMPIADRELETWLLVDLSPSLHFGTAAMTKLELAVTAAGVFGFLTSRAGNRLGALLLGEQIEVFPASRGRRQLQALLHRLATTPAEESSEAGTSTDLAGALRRLGHVARRRGLVVVISDFLTDSAWQTPMAELAQRHEVIAVEIIDPRELDLPPVGVIRMRDVETGRTREVMTNDAAFRSRYAAAARAERQQNAVRIRAAGADHLMLLTDRDWLIEVVAFVMARHRRRLARPTMGAVGRRRAGTPTNRDV